MAIPEPKVILQLAADLETAKAHVAALQAKWDGYFSPSTPEPTKPTPAHVKRPSNADSLTGKIIRFLATKPQGDFSGAEIASGIGEAQDKVQKTINKLAFKKRIGRPSYGRYQAATKGESYVH